MTLPDSAETLPQRRALFDIFDSHQRKENDMILPLLVDSSTVSLIEIMHASATSGMTMITGMVMPTERAMVEPTENGKDHELPTVQTLVDAALRHWLGDLLSPAGTQCKACDIGGWRELSEVARA